MEITSATLSLSSSYSIPRPHVSLPFFASSSTFLANNCCSTLSKKSRVGYISNPAARTTIKQSRKGFTCNAMFGLGVPELAVIAGVAVLVFGPKKLPEVGRSIGKTVKSFQQVRGKLIIFIISLFSLFN